MRNKDMESKINQIKKVVFFIKDNLKILIELT